MYIYIYIYVWAERGSGRSRTPRGGSNTRLSNSPQIGATGGAPLGIRVVEVVVVVVEVVAVIVVVVVAVVVLGADCRTIRPPLRGWALDKQSFPRGSKNVVECRPPLGARPLAPMKQSGMQRLRRRISMCVYIYIYIY